MMTPRGGYRPDAGRKSLGIKKGISISIPHEQWDTIDKLIAAGHYKGYADYFRQQHERNYRRNKSTLPNVNDSHDDPGLP